MELTILFPYISVYGSNQVLQQAITTSSLPTIPDNRGEALVLTQQVGVFSAGSYLWVNNRWQLTLDYATICDQVFGVSRALVLTPGTGDNFLAIGSSGAAIVRVYKNGVLQPTSYYTVTATGISLSRPTVLYEVYLVLQISQITPMTDLSQGGSGIVDAPVDGNAYVRKNAAWENIQNELNEGSFTGL
jgi:hypothetical protein